MTPLMRAPRRPNTNRTGGQFTDQEKLAVWRRTAIAQPGVSDWRIAKDRCGAWIHFDHYGRTDDNGDGWEIDHIIPVSAGGSDDLVNLQALQWQNNRKKGDDYPASSNEYCIVRAVT